MPAALMERDATAAAVGEAAAEAAAVTRAQITLQCQRKMFLANTFCVCVCDSVCVYVCIHLCYLMVAALGVNKFRQKM